MGKKMEGVSGAVTSRRCGERCIHCGLNKCEQNPVELESLPVTHPLVETSTRLSVQISWGTSSACVSSLVPSENEQNLEILQGELQLQLRVIELVQVQTPSVESRPIAPRGHPQTAGNRGNVDEKTRLPGEEDRARTHDSQEAWHEKQEGYVFLVVCSIKGWGVTPEMEKKTKNCRIFCSIT